MKGRQQSGFSHRRPIQWLRGASSDSNRQTTDILVSISAESSPKSIGRDRGTHNFAGSCRLAAWVEDCGVFSGREDGQATEFDGGHRRPDAGDPVAELSARMPRRHCKMKRLWKRTATTGLSVVGKAR